MDLPTSTTYAPGALRRALAYLAEGDLPPPPRWWRRLQATARRGLHLLGGLRTAPCAAQHVAQS